MAERRIVSAQAWLEARKALLAGEKEFTKARDRLTAEIRALPWTVVEKEYVFDGPAGRETLADLFEARSQLIVHHFMFHESWDEACKSCSFWADNYEGTIVHLNHRDVSMVTVSQAPLAKLQAFRERMGWSFKWVSSHGSDFNRDFHVSFTDDERESGTAFYNYRRQSFPAEEAHGFSVFFRDDDGRVFHTYSTYGRGTDMLNGTYHFLDLVPKGRDEGHLDYTMDWLRLHDAYGDR